MNPASNEPNTTFYTYGDTERYRDEVRKNYPTCIVNVRKQTFNETGETCLTNTFFKEYSCFEAINTYWPKNLQIKYIGQLCRVNSKDGRVCSAFNSMTAPVFKKFIQEEINKTN